MAENIIVVYGEGAVDESTENRETTYGTNRNQAAVGMRRQLDRIAARYPDKDYDVWINVTPGNFRPIGG